MAYVFGIMSKLYLLNPKVTKFSYFSGSFVSFIFRSVNNFELTFMWGKV